MKGSRLAGLFWTASGYSVEKLLAETARGGVLRQGLDTLHG